MFRYYFTYETLLVILLYYIKSLGTYIVKEGVVCARTKSVAADYF